MAKKDNPITRENLTALVLKHRQLTGFYTMVELKEDIYKICIIRKMANSFIKCGSTTERLFLNNIITIVNVLGISGANFILREACDDKAFSVIKSCLIFLKCCIGNDDVDHNQAMLDLLNDIRERMEKS